MFTVASAHIQTALAKARSDEGAGIVEYVLLIVAIALVVLVAMSLLANTLSNTFNTVGTKVTPN